MRLSVGQKQFLRFCAVGLLNTIGDLVLYATFHQAIGWGSVLSSTLTVFIVMSVSFILNSLFVFKATLKLKSYLKFLVVTMAGIAIIQGVFSQFLEPLAGRVAEQYIGDGSLEVFIANSATRITGTVFSLAWNFLFYKWVVFKLKGNVEITRSGSDLDTTE